MMIRNWFAVAVLMFAAPLALRADEGTLSVSPAVVMLKGSVGQSTSQTLTLMNATSQPLAFDMVAKDVVVRDGKRVMVDAGQLAGSVAGTAVFSPKSVTVAPGEKQTVQVTVTIPPNPAARGIIAMFQGTTKVQSRGMQITASLGTLLTFALSDGGTAEASPLAVTPPTPTSNLNVAQSLSNDSTEPLLAQGMLAIVNEHGTLVAKQGMVPRRLLPGERIAMSAQYDGDLAAGHYRALVTYLLQNKTSLTSSAEFDVR